MSLAKQNRIRRAKAGDIDGRRWWIKFIRGSFPFASVKRGLRKMFKDPTPAREKTEGVNHAD